MAELKEEHFEVIDNNKAKAHEEQKEMREASLTEILPRYHRPPLPMAIDPT